nr:3' terminal RNA ribose 2'-O-methyltransferase Hen1 [Sanguibacter keddieii]
MTLGTTSTGTTDGSSAGTFGDASDLGFVLHKHPARAQELDLPVGRAHVFYPEATAARCTVALLLEVDPVGLVRGKKLGKDSFALGQYVNDRPYAASSLVAVALGRVFRSALNGVCTARPELVGQEVPLTLHVPALPSRGGADLVRRLFEPLGWTVDARALPLDEQVPAWGDSRYVDLTLTGTTTVQRALSHLYVLLPVLDDAKHYWVDDTEVDKLLRAAGEWLGTHPEQETITTRYLAHQRDLVADAVGRLDPETAALEGAGRTEGAERAGAADDPEGSVPRPPSLARVRREALLAELETLGATTVVDLGCGEGALLRELLHDPRYTSVLGVDVSHRELARAERRLGLDRMPDAQRARLGLLQSSVTYRDDRFAGHDAVVLSEVVEHLDLPRLPALERTVFEHAAPRHVLVTTPNAEHNVRYPALAGGGFRHPDHRFEWTRAELADWAEQVGERYGYTVRYVPVGEDDPEVGPPTQMAVFSRRSSTASPSSSTAGPSATDPSTASTTATSTTSTTSSEGTQR